MIFILCQLSASGAALFPIEQKKLTASNGASEDQFGVDAAISGNTALVSAPLADVNGMQNAGAVYVYVRSGTNWTQQAILTASDANASASFGGSVALNGDTAVIGASGATANGVSFAGAAYVYVRNGTTWTLQQKLISDQPSDAPFGVKVALNGETVLVSAHGRDVNGQQDAGAAHVFVRSGGVWTQQALLTANDVEAGAQFGMGVALAGDTAVVAAPAADAPGGIVNAGAVYIFVRNGSAWSQQAKFFESSPFTGGGYGQGRVWISGNTVMAGSNRQQVLVYVRNGTSWSLQATLAATDGVGNWFGRGGGALLGDIAVIGAQLTTLDGKGSAGAAYVFQRSGGTWTQTDRLSASDKNFSDSFGASVAMSEDTVVVGAIGSRPSGQSNVGAAYVFTTPGPPNVVPAFVGAVTALSVNASSAANDVKGLLHASDSDSGQTLTWSQSVAPSHGTLSFTGATASSGSADIISGGTITYTPTAGYVGTDSFTIRVSDGTDSALRAISVTVLNTAPVFVGANPTINVPSGGAADLKSALLVNDQNLGQTLIWTQSSAPSHGTLTITGVTAPSGNTNIFPSGTITYAPAPGYSGSDSFAIQVSDGTASDTRTISISVSSPIFPIEQKKLTASNGASEDQFGVDAAISGNTALVSAPLADVNGMQNAGAVYVYVRSGTNWTQQAILTASDANAAASYGGSVALNGDTAVVGASGATANGVSQAGAAYVYVRNGATWTLQQKLISDQPSDAPFGVKVALNGETVLVSAHARDVNGQENAGAVHVFVRNGGVWTQQALLTANDPKAFSSFGFGVALEGDTAAVAAQGADAPGGIASAGAVYIFVRNGSAWSLQTKLFESNPFTGGGFGGGRVWISGNTVMAGSNRQQVYVYVRNGTSWSQQAVLAANDGVGSWFGRGGGAVLGDIAVIGAQLTTLDGKSSAGAAYVFQRSGGIWTQTERLSASDKNFSDSFGASVALSDTTVVVGAIGSRPAGQSNVGAAYVFTMTATNTTPAFVGAGTTLSVNASSTGNDVKGLLRVSDPDIGQTLSWTQSSAPSHGTLSISGATASSGSTDITPGGTITYTPTAGYVGADSFAIQVSDGATNSTRNISVNVPNTAPIFSAAITTFSVPVGSGATLVSLSLKVADSDAGQPLTWSVNTAPAHGTVDIVGGTNISGSASSAITPGGSINYTPAPGFGGTDTFVIQVTDGFATATRTITFNMQNTAPSFIGSSGIAVAVNSGANDIKSALHVSEPNSSQTLTWTASSMPSHGTLNISGATAASPGSNITPGGAITYTPALGYTGADSLVIQVSDGYASVTRTVAINVVGASISSIGNMTMERYRHTATLLPDGHVLLAGGQSGGNILGSAEIYDPSSGTTVPTMGGLNPARTQHGAALLANGTVLVVGGKLDPFNANSNIKSAAIFDPAMGVFSPTGDMTVERSSFPLTLLANGKILVTGGDWNLSSLPLASAELYDPATGTFTLVANSMSQPRRFHSATLLPNGKVLVAGGEAGNGAVLATAELYDPATGTFTTTGSMSNPRMLHTATLLANGKVLVAGGSADSSNSALASAELYDPATGVFSPAGVMGSSRALHSATLLFNGDVLIAGGSADGATALSSTELYQANSGTFGAGPALSAGRLFHTATAVAGGKVLLAGGISLATVDLFEMDPSLNVAATPALVSLSPDNIEGGTGGITLMLRGAGFGADSVVQWNGSPRTTSVYNDALLTAVIPSSDLPATSDLVVAQVTVKNAGSSVSEPRSFVIKSANIGALDTTIVTTGQSVSAAVLPAAPNQPGISATYSNQTPGSQAASVTVATYASNPISGTVIDLGGGVVDLQITGADAGDSVAVKLYYNSTVTALDEASLLLRYYDGSVWRNVLGSGGVPPVLNTTDNLDSTVSGGRWNVVFDNTSTPKVTELSGTPLGSGTNYVPLFLDPSYPPINVPTGRSPIDVRNVLRVTDHDVGQTLVWSQRVGPAHGTLTITGANAASGGPGIQSAGSIVYVPTPGFSGTDTFEIQVTDGMATATSVITFNMQNSVPSFTGSSAIHISPGSFGNDIKSVLRVSEADASQTLTWSAVSMPSHGTLNLSGATATSSGSTMTAGGTITYTPNANYTGPDSLVIQVSDGYAAVTRTVLINVSEASLASAGNMTVDRYGHSGIALTNGKVLLVGGRQSNGTILTSAEVYNPGTGASAVTGSMSQGRTDFAGVLLADGKVLVAGGRLDPFNPASDVKSAEIYDPITGTFSGTGNMSVERSSFPMPLLLNGKALVVGGDGNGMPGPLASAELYDATTGNFVMSGGTMSQPRRFHTANLLSNGKVLVIGGDPGTGSGTATAELYDPATDTFTDTGSLNAGRMRHTATLLANGKVLVAGGVGSSSGGLVAIAELYDPSTGTFTSTGSLVAGRVYHTATLLPNGNVLVAGGSDNPNGPPALASTEIYDVTLGVFGPGPDLSTGRAFHTATAMAGGKVLLAGGFSASSIDVFQVNQSLTSPFLSSITPDNAVNGTGGITLTLQGAGFGPDSIVQWNGGSRVTIFYNEALLAAQIPASDLPAITDVATALVTVKNPGVTESEPKGFTIKSAGIGSYQTAVVGANQNGSAQILPTAPSQFGLSANFFNQTPGSSAVSVTAAVYSSNPVAGTTIDLGGGIVDLQINGADASDSATVNFYYSSAIVGADEANLILRFYDGSSWVPLIGGGGVTPVKNTTDNLNGTVSGGVFAVVFNNTSTPRITELSGTIIAGAINRAPIATADAVTLAEDETLTSTASVLANDTDADGDPLSAVLVSGPSHGQLSFQSNGTFSYVPNANYNGPDSFTYKATDGFADSDAATVSITVTPVNDAPVLVNPIANQSGVYGSLFVLAIPANTFADVDAEQTLSYSVTGLPPGISFDSASGILSGIPSQAGNFAVVLRANDNAMSSLDATASFTISIAKAALIISADNQSKFYGEALPALTASYSGFVNGDSSESLDVPVVLTTTASAASNIGSYPIVPSGAADANYTIHFVNGVLTVSQADAAVLLANLTQTYDGAAKPVNALTTPAGLSVVVTYDGSTTAPVNAGSYLVVATVNDANYSGATAGTLTIEKAVAPVTLSNLVVPYTGTPKAATVTTSPSGLLYQITYDGSPLPRTAAGSYVVVATVNSANYVGSASGMLEIVSTSASPPVVIGADGAIGGSGPLTLDGGTVKPTANATATSPVVLGSAGGKVDTDGNKLTLTGVVSGPGTLTKSGQGVLALTADNTYTGGTKVQGGTVEITRDANLGDVSGPVTLEKAALKVKTETPAALETIIMDRQIQLAPEGGTIDTYGGRSTTQVTESIRGSGTVSKTGEGTLRLTGDQVYTGATSVKDGTLLVMAPSKISNSPITVQEDAKLRGTGEIKTAVIQKGATLAPGNSPGSMTVHEQIDWQAGSIYQWEINDAAGAKGTFGGGWDWLNIGGALNINATSADPVVLDIRSLLVQPGAVEDSDPALVEQPADPVADALEALPAVIDPEADQAPAPHDPSEEANDEVVPYGALANFDPHQNYRWVIATAQGGVNGFSADKFRVNLAGFQGQNQLAGGSFSVEADANSLYLVFTRLNRAPIAQSKSVTVSADANCSATASIDDGSHDIDVNDTITLVQTPAGPYPVGTTQVTLTVTDNHGESSESIATVTVIDDTAPELTVPASIVVSNDPGNCSAVVSFNVTATDNCSVTVVSSPASGSTFPKGTTTVTSVATDASGNTTTKTFTVTVNDVEAPTLVVPSPIVVNNDAGSCGAVVNFTVTAGDNCPGVTVVSTPVSGSAFPKGATTVTSVATDAAGNTTTKTFTVTVKDVEAPILTVPSPIVVNTTLGQCDAPVSFTVTAADNCPNVTVVSTPASGSTFPKGTTTVTSVATDASGNTTTKTFTVTVNDVEAPTLTVPAPIVVSNNPGTCGAVVNFTVTANDSCPGVTVVSTPASGSTFPKGSTTVTSVATDASGNKTTKTFTVTVNDTEAPTLNVPAPIAVTAAAGQCNAVVTFSVTAADNCSAVTVVSTPASGTAFSVGTTMVTSVATDASGNKTTKTFTVTVQEHDVIGRVVLMASNSISLKQKAAILSGDVIVDEAATEQVLADGVELSIGQNATTPSGYQVKANRITLSQKAVLAGDVYYNTLNNAQNTTIGTRHTPLPLPVYCHWPAFENGAAGTQDITVQQNGTLTLNGGSYRDVSINQKGTIVFSGGVYNLRNLNVGQNAKVLFTAPTVIHIADKLAFDQKTIVGPNVGSGIGADDIVFYVNGINGTTGRLNASPEAVKIGQNSAVRGNIYAPNGTLTLEQKSSGTGAFLAKDIAVGQEVELTLESRFGSAGTGNGLLSLGQHVTKSSLAPVIAGPDLLSNGTVELQFTGTPGMGYQVQASEDLQQWEIVDEVRMGREGLIRFEEPASADRAVRFYRIVPMEGAGSGNQ